MGEARVLNDRRSSIPICHFRRRYSATGVELRWVSAWLKAKGWYTSKRFYWLYEPWGTECAGLINS